MRRLILGTAGHIDHGKTALVRALTGVDTDRLPEEKQRGITIDLGFASLHLDDGTEVGIVDVPGHEGFIRNMLAGATGIDMALLVVAADEGVMPQTREHLAILELLGVRSLIVALTKTDLVDDDWRELAAEDVRQLLRDGPFALAPIVPVSVKASAGLADLVATIARAANSVAERNQDDVFRLPIDRVFTVRGTGTVVTGTVWSGKIARDQTVRLQPASDELRVRAIQSHGQDQPMAAAGARAALALAAASREQLARGDVLVHGDAWRPSTRLTAKLRLLRDSPPLHPGQRVRFHLATAEVMARVTTFDRRDLEPGHEAWVLIRLEAPVVPRARDPFVLRSYSPITTIAGGTVAEPTAPRRRRNTPDTATSLQNLVAGDARSAIVAALDLAGWAGIRLDALPIATGLPPREIADALAQSASVLRIGDHAWARHLLDRATEVLLGSLADLHAAAPLSPGMPREQLKQRLPEAEPAFAEWVVQHLTAEGRLHADPLGLRLAGFVPTLQPDQLAAATAILASVQAAGLQAPAPDELPAPLSARRDLLDLLHHLARSGQLVPLPQNRYLTPGALETAIRLATQSLGQRDDLTPGDFRDLFGVSRKYLIPLLEHFDRTHVTVRSGEFRRLAGPAKTAQPTTTSS